MKSVLFVHHGDTSGGASKSLKFLIERIDKVKYQCAVVCRTTLEDAAFFKDDDTTVILEPGIKPFHGSTVSGISFKQFCYNIVYAFASFWAMRKVVKRVKPDIVHLNSTCLFVCAAAVKSVDRKTRIICHVREPLLPNMFGAILKHMCNRFCDHFIAIDAFDGKSVDPNGKKTSVIYNFVDFTKYHSDLHSTVLREELQLNDNALIFLVLARISPENGIFELLAEWKNAIHDNLNQLVIVGELEGREQKYTEKCHRIADGVENIHILPFRGDVCDVIASSDVIICPFTKPHFARSIIESAAMRKPALSKWIDGPKELIVDGRTGLFYDKENQHDLAEKVELLSKNTEFREKLGLNAEAYSKMHFNADINAANTFELYES